MRSISQCEGFPGVNSDEFPGVKDFLVGRISRRKKDFPLASISQFPG